jgi:hypothetical protein
VRDEQDAELRSGFTDRLDAARHDSQRVDVETGVGLVEHGEIRLHQRHLQDLVALLLAAGEPLVEVPLDESRVHPQPLGPVEDGHPHLEHREVLDALPGRHRLPQEVQHGDPGDLLGMLEPEEQAPARPLVGRQGRDVLTLEEDPARGHLVGRVAEERGGEGRLPRPVRAHERVQLTGGEGERHPAQDLVALDRDVQVVDLERGRRGGIRGHGAIVITLRT